LPPVAERQKYPNRVKEQRLRAGLSQEQLAERAGFGNQTDISRLERGEARLTFDKLAAVAQALEIEEKELLPADAARSVVKSPSPSKRVGVNSPPRPDPKDWTLPVRGIAHGGDGRARMLPDDAPPVDWSPCPPQLQGVPEAYALFVFEESMWPVYRHGQTLWVHPHQPAREDDGVIVILADGEVLVKEFVRQTEKTLTLRQYGRGKKPAEFEVARTKVTKIHRIVGVYHGR
jgi:phage repressor protein C with HTH and peptisase S24 domain